MPVDGTGTVEGLVDVGGRDLYARCAGEGSPTVLYFTGWAGDPGDPPKFGVGIAKGIERALGSDLRVCSYERRNMGRSDIVAGEQIPENVIEDVDRLLDALGEDGPLLLLGASFGGQVAEAYAVTHPDRVVGVVNLDGSTGADYETEALGGFQGMCLASNRAHDAIESVERIDNCRLAEYIHDRRDEEPDVPLLYLATAESWPEGARGQALAQEWVESWSPGEWRLVSAPHEMDQADTALVADAIREVIDLAE